MHLKWYQYCLISCPSIHWKHTWTPPTAFFRSTTNCGLTIFRPCLCKLFDRLNCLYIMHLIQCQWYIIIYVINLILFLCFAQVKCIVLQLLKGLAYLHHNFILHRSECVLVLFTKTFPCLQLHSKFAKGSFRVNSTRSPQLKFLILLIFFSDER